MVGEKGLFCHCSPENLDPNSATESAELYSFEDYTPLSPTPSTVSSSMSKDSTSSQDSFYSPSQEKENIFFKHNR